MKKSVIHIGANKTASTTLQRALFSQHSGLQYMGEDASDYDDYCESVNSMASDDGQFFDSKACKTMFQQRINQAGDKTFIYSNEDVMTSRIPSLCADRLKSYLPDSKILLVIRNQNTAIPSFYANHGAFLKPATPRYFRRHVAFDDWMTSQIMFNKYGALASFHYYRLLLVYAELFGMENIHVLMFEEFLDNKKAFVRKLCDVLDIDNDEALLLLGERHERKRITSRMLTYNRFRTSFFWGVNFCKYIPGGDLIESLFQRFIESGSIAKITLTQHWQEEIYQLYAKDNQKLAKEFNLPLDKYHYPVA